MVRLSHPTCQRPVGWDKRTTPLTVKHPIAVNPQRKYGQQETDAPAHQNRRPIREEPHRNTSRLLMRGLARCARSLDAPCLEWKPHFGGPCAPCTWSIPTYCKTGLRLIEGSLDGPLVPPYLPASSRVGQANNTVNGKTPNSRKSAAEVWTTRNRAPAHQNRRPIREEPHRNTSRGCADSLNALAR